MSLPIVLHRITSCYIELQCTLLYSTALHCTVLDCTLLYFIVLYCSALHYFALFCYTLQYILWHCVALCCVVSYRIVSAYRVFLCHVVSVYRVVSCLLVSCRVVSCRIELLCFFLSLRTHFMRFFLEANVTKYYPAPWINAKEQETHPVNIWYWVREQNFNIPRSCLEVQLRGVQRGKKSCIQGPLGPTLIAVCN